ncbi:pirin family protein [Flagellimonas allohymeniacidonis]|uniref:Pirin family protein n=2 Tax=Flagellimonas allohymeniacidonis TaxID=2517819 RepID=A0A4Q8QIE4_9FLAO|nr:pirin family protein [Allomuricauda hymeniacidonis]
MSWGGILAAFGVGNYLKAASNSSSGQKTNVKQIGFNHIRTMETKTATTVLHKADTRGKANHGWLNSHHSFSFANYYNPDRMNFGVLRVLNDDVVSAGMGFGTHPHNNMEIISIPLEGDLEHKDSMGTSAIIKQGDVQVMSAGTGIMHSEYNANKDKEVKFLQIWVMPNKQGVTPRYDQITLDLDDRKNTLQQILSPNKDDAGIWIHQNAWFNMTSLEQGKSLYYKLNDAKNNGVYAFVIDGNVTINGQQLEKRDGFGLWDIENLDITADSDTELLLMEVPMNIA